MSHTLRNFITSPSLQIALMLGLCAVSALLGFRMGAPAGSGMNDAVLISATKNSQKRSGHAVPSSGSEWQPQAPEMATVSPAGASHAPKPSQLAAGSLQHEVPAPARIAAPATQVKKTFHQRQAPRTPPRVLVPMVFRNIDPSALGLSAAQWQEIDRMRANFTEKVGTQEPANPSYRQRWVSAQFEADEQLRSFLGWEKFNQYQIAAVQSAR